MKIIGQKQKMSIPDYVEYVKYLRDQGYSRDQLTIDENSEIVCINSLEKGSVGTVIDIRCPCGHKMIIAGRAQLSDKAHALALRLADRDNIEIAPDTRIRILKEKVSNTITIVETMFYQTISATSYTNIPENKTKPFDERYIFSEGIEINGGEHLKIDAINPDICIDAKNVKLYLDIDIWEGE